MKRRLISFLVLMILSLSLLSARSLELIEIPYSRESILWPEVGRDCFEMERGKFELEGPDERWFEISLEGKEKHHHLGSSSRFLKREMDSIARDEMKDAKKEGRTMNTVVSLSDDSHYHLTLEFSDRFGIYYKSFIGLLLDGGTCYEFEAEYLKEDAFTVEKIEESILSLQ